MYYCPYNSWSGTLPKISQSQRHEANKVWKQPKCSLMNEWTKKIWNIHIYAMLNCSVISDSLWPQDYNLPGSCPWEFPGKDTRVSCHFLLQGIFLTQGLNTSLLCLLHCRLILYLLSHWGIPYVDMCVYTHTHTHTHTMEYYSAFKKKEVLPFATT